MKNNFYTLFNTAEQIKKLFYGKVGALEVTVTSEQKEQRENTVLLDKWKLSFWKGNSLTVEKMIPEVMMNYFEIELLLSGEIYGIVQKFMEELYHSGRIQDFSFIKLTGQSCKIDLFKDALKEFVPGRMIQFRKRANIDAADFELKMISCILDTSFAGYGGNYFEEYGGFDSSAVFEKCGRGGTLPFSVCMQARRFFTEKL